MGHAVMNGVFTECRGLLDMFRYLIKKHTRLGHTCSDAGLSLAVLRASSGTLDRDFSAIARNVASDPS